MSAPILSSPKRVTCLHNDSSRFCLHGTFGRLSYTVERKLDLIMNLRWLFLSLRWPPKRNSIHRDVSHPLESKSGYSIKLSATSVQRKGKTFFRRCRARLPGRDDWNTLAFRETSKNIKNNFNGNFPVKATKVIFRLFNEIKQVTSFDFVQYGVVKVYDNNLCRRRRKCD